MVHSGFGSYLVVCPASFFLGILFTNWSADHSTLWQNPVPEAALAAAAEEHYSLLAAIPRVMQYILHSVILIGLSGHIIKLHKGNDSNWLFDGASLVLYMISLVIYGKTLVFGLLHSQYDLSLYIAFWDVSNREYQDLPRSDTLRVIAATHLIMAVVLMGVLLLQGGQYYAQKAAEKELIEMEEAAIKKKKSH
ncbi:Secretory component protein psh3 [Neolecta irregularis DAH-3]|uniref:Secretory component protein psh3 n=1 Tax=Neolecta irregularis (strain DAH-3) TaxID=1198029 RepID=A0A1U7LJQ2_NEOID|nr:Secretory component protein psh3 [Neolecta irregularis DAH-3]|eukprot:OLL22885.1 Secretory component protein psh3 [Neolecta irregularis DAH-3]